MKSHRARIPAVHWLFLMALVLGGLLDTAEGSPEDGVYTLELYVVCDKECNEKISEKYNTESYLLDTFKTSARSLGILNVDLILVGLEIWSRQNKVKAAENMDQALDYVSEYRKTTLLPKRWNDAILVVTGMDWSVRGGEALGLFKVGGICTAEYGAGIIIYEGQTAASLASAVTHELGHGLGMLHDSSGCCSVGNGNCIMAPILSNYHVVNPVFSSCSLENFKSYVSTARSECLYNKATRVYPPNTCGNGVVEEGEECDCGQACLNNCCDCCNRCKLVSQAECSSGICCRTATCKFYGRRRECRKQVDAACDLVDFCTGDSSECPNQYRDDGAACEDSQSQAGYCLGGRCRTRNVQCMETWTQNYTDANDACYAIAQRYPGEKGHCGKTPGGTYVACSKNSVNYYQCGLLQCAGDGTGLSRYMDPQRNYFVGGGHYCLSGKYGDWDDRRWTPIMVADGTKCNEDKVCYRNDCRGVAEVFRLLEEEKVSGGNMTKLPSSLCGDGVLNEGEQCDCGPLQCDCCDPVTCTLSAEGQNCIYNQCGKCDGKSSLCTRQAALDVTPCDNGEGHCIKGECHSLRRACRRIFGPSAEVPLSRYITNTFGNSSQSNGGGYLLYDLNVFTWATKKEYIPASGDGQCGLLLCKTGNNQATITDDRSRQVTSKTFFLRDDPSIRIAYYSIETLRLGPNEYYQKYMPVLVDQGTPCQTTIGKLGYCDVYNLRMDQSMETWYWYSRCVSI